MPVSCKVGAVGWDAAAWVRAKTRDYTPPYLIPDAQLLMYIESAVERFSRFFPLDAQVGDMYANTSPLVTVAGQTRYVCSPANGFAVEPDRITDLLYRAGSNIGLNAANDMAYLYMSPFSSPTSFLGAGGLDQPADRYLRNSYFQELLKYGYGQYGFVVDGATGLPAFDLYPTPTQNGLPIFARYQYQHQNTPDGQNNPWYKTVSSIRKVTFARALLIELLEDQLDNIATTGKSRLGIIQYEGGSPEAVRDILKEQEAKFELATGAAVPVASVG